VRRFTPIRVLAADFGQRTELRLQGVPNGEYSLRLFVDDVEKEEEDIYIGPRLQVRITGPRCLLPRCARQPAVRTYRGRKYVQWNGGVPSMV
jgi:hypothetical protein